MFHCGKDFAHLYLIFTLSLYSILSNYLSLECRLELLTNNLLINEYWSGDNCIVSSSLLLTGWVKFSTADILKYLSYSSQKLGFHKLCKLQFA